MRRTTARFFVKSALPARKPPPVTVYRDLNGIVAMKKRAQDMRSLWLLLHQM
jgi:hypothetical protein